MELKLDTPLSITLVLFLVIFLMFGYAYTAKMEMETCINKYNKIASEFNNENIKKGLGATAKPYAPFYYNATP